MSSDVEKDDAWGQTIFTVTPEENATLRQILNTAILSSTPDVPLVLEDKIVFRRSFTHRQFIDSKESLLESLYVAYEDENVPRKRPKQDAENQTYLEGTPIVQISVEYRDEASQTMYMSPLCPPLKYYKDIMTSMNEVPMPALKTTTAVSTIISFHPKTLNYIVSEELSTNITKEILEEFVSEVTNEEKTEMEVNEIVYFLIARALWIIDPTSLGEVEVTDKETQTLVKFNYFTNSFTIDCETQTDLTCEPKKSNTTLLSEYCETRNIISSILEDCLSKGIESRIIINDIVDDIIDKCTDRIRYPMVDQDTQTIVTYRSYGKKEEDVLRKLKLDVVVDPQEATTVIEPLMDDLLQLVSDTVSRNAVRVVRCTLELILRRTMTIIMKLTELQQESKPTQKTHVLEQRRKKILESMLKTETEATCTQTNIAGIYEIQKIKEEKDVVCSVCRRPSMCKWCLDDHESEAMSREEINMLRTQDILLAYKPCYIMTTASEKETNLQPLYPPVKKVYPPPMSQARISKHSTEESEGTIDILLQPEIVPKKSINEWSYVTDATLMKPCSIKESLSDTSHSISSLEKSMSKCGQNSYCLRKTPPEAINALQILKDTLCSQENCLASSLHSLKKNYSPKDFVDICDNSTCINSKSSRIPKKFGNSFKVIPICLLQNSETKRL